MKNIYSVAQVNSYIKNMFIQDYLLQSMAIRGEISNCKYHSSGHIYFTLKDERGSLACIMFASYANKLGFKASDGQMVVVRGSIEVYERDGKYQLYAKEMELDGVGRLYEQYLALKGELEDMGMFSKDYKQEIPFYAKRLGIVTAKTGAAIRDIIQVAKRRNPYIEIVVYSAYVQGEKAVASIVTGIETLEAYGVDVMIVGRGGGSIEDLWAFNERAVAEAVFHCSVPIISAVGHETDTTIIDFVSDMRAPTPSAAAELAVCDIRGLCERVEQYRQSLKQALYYKLDSKREKLNHLKRLLEAKHPRQKLLEQSNYVWQLEERLQHRFQAILEKKKHTLSLYVTKMHGLSPLLKLEQGMAYVSDEENRAIYSVDQVKLETRLKVQFKDGSLKVKVEEKEQENAEEKYRNET